MNAERWRCNQPDPKMIVVKNATQEELKINKQQIMKKLITICLFTAIYFSGHAQKSSDLIYWLNKEAETINEEKSRLGFNNKTKQLAIRHKF